MWGRLRRESSFCTRASISACENGSLRPRIGKYMTTVLVTIAPSFGERKMATSCVVAFFILITLHRLARHAACKYHIDHRHHSIESFHNTLASQAAEPEPFDERHCGRRRSPECCVCCTQTFRCHHRSRICRSLLPPLLIPGLFCSAECADNPEFMGVFRHQHIIMHR